MNSWIETIDEDTLRDLWENPPNMNANLEQSTVVYLDQKAWGNLLAGSLDEDSEYRDAYELVKRSTEELDYLYPFSISNLIETGAHLDRGFRKRLYQLMFEISKNHSLRNYLEVTRLEACAYVWSRIPHLKTIDTRQEVVKKGIVQPHGTFRLKPEEWLTDEQRNKIHRVLASDKMNEAVFNSDGLVDYIDTSKNDQEEYLRTLEQGRDVLSPPNTFDSELEKLGYVSAAFQNHELPIIDTIGEQLAVNARGYVDSDLRSVGTFLFLSQFPALYTYAHLAFARDSHTDRSIETGDLNDIMSLAVGVPYSDIVVTEKFFGGMLYSHSINKTFDTKVLFDLKKLANIIASELDDGNPPS